MRIDNKILDDSVKNEKILLAFKKRFNIGLESVRAGFAAKLLYTAYYILHSDWLFGANSWPKSVFPVTIKDINFKYG